MIPRLALTPSTAGLSAALPAVVLLGLVGLAPACSGGDEETDLPDLPPEDTDTGAPDTDDTGGGFPIDTDDGGPTDLVPANYLHLYQDGALTLGPAGGPYEALEGTLHVLEFLDYQLPPPGDDTDVGDTDPVDTDLSDTDPPPDRPWEALEESPLVCEVVYALSGAPPEVAPDTPCPDCAFVMDVTFTVVEGNPGPCYDPELPADGEVRRFGWADGSATLLMDLGGLGAWYPWYRGSRTGDVVTFAWEEVLAVSVEPDEEED